MGKKEQATMPYHYLGTPLSRQIFEFKPFHKTSYHKIQDRASWV